MAITKRLDVYVLLRCSQNLQEERVLGVYINIEDAKKQKKRILDSMNLTKLFYLGIDAPHIAIIKQRVAGNYLHFTNGKVIFDKDNK